MNTIRPALILALLWAISPHSSAGQQDTLRLSLEDALKLASTGNPAFLAARNDEVAADWEVREAYASLLPSASVGAILSYQGAGEQRFGSFTLAQNLPAYYLSSYTIGLSYQLSGATLLAPSAARARRVATSAQIRAAEVSLRAVVTRAYVEVLRRAEGEALMARQLKRTRFNLRLAQGRHEVGAVTPLDVRQAEVRVGRAEVDLLQASNALHTARLRLLQEIGADGERTLVLTTDFDLDEPVWDREALRVTALESNPTLGALRAALEAGTVQVRQAQTAYLPTLSAQAGISGYTREATNSGSLIAQAQVAVAQQVQQCVLLNQLYSRLADPLPGRDCSAIRFTDAERNQIVAQNDAFPFDFTRQPLTMSLSLSLPLFQGLTRERQLEVAKVQRDDADLQVREQRIALNTNLTIALGSVTTAYQSAVLEARNRDVADEQLRLAGERYRVGAISFVDLVEAETVKAEADQAYVNAIYAYHDAVTDLGAVVGTPLRE